MVQKREDLLKVKSRWPLEEVEVFFDYLDIIIGKVYSSVCDLDVKRFWLSRFDSYPLNDVMKGFHRMIESGKIYGRPTPDLLFLELSQNNLSLAREKWSEVQDAVRLIGPHRSVEFSSPDIAFAVRSIGWFRICSAYISDESALFALFTEKLAHHNPSLHDSVVLGLGNENRKALGITFQEPTKTPAAEQRYTDGITGGSLLLDSAKKTP